MTEPQWFDVRELARVLAAALLGLDDDAAPPDVVVVQNGREREVTYVGYDPIANRLILDIGTPTGRRSLAWPTTATPWFAGPDPWRNPLDDPRRRVTRPGDLPS